MYRRISADLETPVSVFLKLRQNRASFLFESVEQGTQVARYSFIGTASNNTLKCGQGDGMRKGDPLSVLQSEMQAFNYATLPELPRFSGGAVGYIAYDAVSHFEPTVPPITDEASGMGVPEAAFMLIDEVVAFDHVSQEMLLIVNVHIGSGDQDAYSSGLASLDRLEQTLRSARPASVISHTLQNRTVARPFDELAANYRFNIGFDEYQHSVNRCIEQIHAGELIQVVFSQRLTRDITHQPFEFYRALRRLNPSPYMVFLDLGDFQIVGASPERLVAVKDDRVSIHPIAGTRPRGATSQADRQLAQDLLNDPKERAEHLMLLDLGRNDVGRVCQPGTVRVTRDTQLEYYSNVIHIVSNVEGRLNPHLRPLDALRAGFPAGTVTGAPKVRAMQLIAELERQKRGPYAGAIGYFSYSGDLDTCIALRTMVIKDGVATLQAGGGIVADSVVDNEYKETLHKLTALMRAIEEIERDL